MVLVSGDPDEPQLKYLGSLPVLTILSPQQAADDGLLGLALYDGEGVAYQIHEDYVPKADYDPENLPEHHRESYKRRVTAILYLQDDWSEELGGAFRAHAVRPKTEAWVPVTHVSRQEGGSLILFRSDMPHEVLPTYGQRFALSMWCHAA
ncbi:ABC transporter G family member 22 [Durusdinium trenchii]|uniref:ABC transporter G family member 22 n=1 Tax=Durusdinium trenchii TaxID=1381693 RepID=A0ABP0J8H4_9DINO